MYKNFTALKGGRQRCWPLKTILIMKLTFILIAVTFMQVSAATYAQRVSLNVKTATLADVFDQVQAQTRYDFLYKSDELKLAKRVSLKVKDATLQQVLELCFANQPLSYKIENTTILISAKPVVKAAKVTLTGKVTDTKGEPLPGVTVREKNGQGSAMTDQNGNYKISVEENAVLVFSYIGFTGLEVPVSGRTTVNAVLQDSNQGLNEVVVIGYGSREKKDLTGSVATITAAQVKDLPVASIDQKLVGQMPGVRISQTTGTPGGGTTVRVRGSGSIGAGDNPLYVIDGFAISNTTGQVYNPLNVLSPDDIESVSVLKDASSTAIYGSRGSNGVVIITTKKGKKGAPIVNVNSYIGVQQVPQKGRQEVLNGTEYAQFRRDMIVDAFAAQGRVATDADIPEQFRNPAQYGEGTDWYDAVLQSGIQHNIDASLRGGTDSTQYSFSVGRLKQDGTIKYTDYTRYTLQANVQSQLSKRLKVTLNIAPSGGIQNRNSFETGQRDVLTRTLWLSPIVPINQPDGSRTLFITSPGAIGAGNPLNTLEFAGTNAKYFRGLASATAELEIMTGLKAKYAYNVDYTSNKSSSFSPSFVYGETSNQNPNPAIPGSSTDYGEAFNWLSELTVNYDKNFGQDHKFNALLGYTAQKERSEGFGINATNYPDNLIETINASPLINGQRANVDKWSLISYLARVNYTFKDRYLVTASIRSDGSSRFGANKRYGTFPSAALGWRVSEEDFMKEVKWVSNLKLRATYGLAGNFNIGNYLYASNVGSANYTFGGTVAGGRASTSISNSELTWENSKQFDMGVDMSILKNRVNFTLDYYNRITYNLLLSNELPLSSGFASATVNLGKMRNRGFEGTVSADILSGGFTWNTSANISFNKNIVLGLNQNNAPIYSGRSGEGNFTHKTEVGKPLGQFYGYIVEGVYRDQADFNNSPKNASSVVGSIKYRDVDGNGIIEPVKDFAVIGDPYPDFTYGLTNNFGYKNFDLNILLVGSQGGEIMKSSNEFLSNIDGVFNVDRKVLNRWRSPENPGDGVTPTTNGGRVLYRDVNSAWIEDASFLRIQNITLGYNFKQKFATKANFFKGLRVYGSVQNLVTFTKYSGGNPEALTNGANALTPGRDFLGYPLPRTITMGVNMTF
ncbi:TonB-dependent receptor [Pedobacter sp. MC2016-15]|uniref:TonB-dependent receptor n=1 Tax=Pedobacter sp. MC2016-15 TaxID=2994473 RepID=UPI0022475D75|nr:TonB-dependent receptor [Pedobacter sp. MC2016-15]MCX2478211.1 TonB-dependent receptor [Pedobacter sp. MC2016-15]